MSSQAHVIKTRLPSPPPALPDLLANVHAAVQELKAKDVVEIDVLQQKGGGGLVAVGEEGGGAGLDEGVWPG